MNSKYEKWVAEHTEICAGANCAEATSLLIIEFPELTRVRGHYYCVVWGEREHWWCVDPQDNIVDPTASQFPTKGGAIMSHGRSLKKNQRVNVPTVAITFTVGVLAVQNGVISSIWHTV